MRLDTFNYITYTCYSFRVPSSSERIHGKYNIRLTKQGRSTLQPHRMLSAPSKALKARRRPVYNMRHAHLDILVASSEFLASRPFIIPSGAD